MADSPIKSSLKSACLLSLTSLIENNLLDFTIAKHILDKKFSKLFLGEEKEIKEKGVTNLSSKIYFRFLCSAISELNEYEIEGIKFDFFDVSSPNVDEILATSTTLMKHFQEVVWPIYIKSNQTKLT